MGVGLAFFLHASQNSGETVSLQEVTQTVQQSKKIQLPLSGSISENVTTHTIPIAEIRQGCFRKDCIPSIDEPVFSNISEANELVSDDVLGIALSYKEEERFYPFSMLVTREIVNDIVADEPLLITYCPLCGTGIVFERTIDGQIYEFGVSGMLWQSNLLMYNRDEDIERQNLWSQVLGQAVVGKRAGEKLTVIPSDVMQYGTWKQEHPQGQVLITGNRRDPYDGRYYEVAKNFAPNFDESLSTLSPSEYVYGIEVEGIFKAYPRVLLPGGDTNDIVNGVELVITKFSDETVIIKNKSNEVIADVEGFWFSWVSAHPDTLLWKK